MVPPVTRDNDEGETSEDRDSGVGQNGGFRRRRVRTASESMNEENKDLRLFHESSKRPKGDDGRDDPDLLNPGVAAQGWGERSSRRSSTISDISDINLEVDSSGFEAGAKADDENDDEDDDDVTTAVRGTRRKNWGSHLTLPGPRSPEEGSTTPYHIIEILINSGGDNLPGISRIRLSEMLRRRSTPFVSEEEGQQLRLRLQANAKKPSLEVPNDDLSASSPSASGGRRASGGKARKPHKGLKRQTTLALLTLGEDEQRISRRYKRKTSDGDDSQVQGNGKYNSAKLRLRRNISEEDVPPPPYTAAMVPRPRPPTPSPKKSVIRRPPVASGSMVTRTGSIFPGPGPGGVDSRQTSGGSFSENINMFDEEEEDDEKNAINGADCCTFWPWFLADRPILRLFLVMGLNGLVSMGVAAIFIELESPAQKERFNAKDALKDEVEFYHRNLTLLLKAGSNPVAADSVLDTYNEKLRQLADTKKEVEWNMLSASEFVTSVMTTLGYGDIVPVTLGGRIFTLIYALYGIPVFMWYIIMLGVLFRSIVARATTAVLGFYRKRVSHSADVSEYRSHMRNVFLLASRPIRVLPGVVPKNISQEFRADKRFHPTVIGTILVIFIVTVAAFISYMEGHTYFDSVYACFITYSTIGFGDITIYRISYRANWFNLMVYGNCVHIVGYMIVTAWVTSIVTKCGAQTGEKRQGSKALTTD